MWYLSLCITITVPIKSVGVAWMLRGMQSAIWKSIDVGDWNLDIKRCYGWCT